MANEKIYTIKITEAMAEKCGCPLCRVESLLEKDELERILGAAMMEPDVRLQTNAQGFCDRHLATMLGMNNKLSLALMLSTHLETLSEKLYRDSVPLLKKTPDPKKQLAVLEKQRGSCYLCARKNEFMNATIDTFAYLFKTDAAFEQKIKEQPFFCLKHTRLLYLAAARALSKDAYRRFCDAINAVNTAYASTLAEDIDWFCKKFDYRYQNEDWKNAKDAVERTVQFLKQE